MYYAKVCYELAGSISRTWRHGSTATYITKPDIEEREFVFVETPLNWSSGKRQGLNLFFIHLLVFAYHAVAKDEATRYLQ